MLFFIGGIEPERLRKLKWVAQDHTEKSVVEPENPSYYGPSHRSDFSHLPISAGTTIDSQRTMLPRKAVKLKTIFTSILQKLFNSLFRSDIVLY